jgi:hypothetical protein
MAIQYEDYRGCVLSWPSPPIPITSLPWEVTVSGKPLGGIKLPPFTAPTCDEAKKKGRKYIDDTLGPIFLL